MTWRMSCKRMATIVNGPTGCDFMKGVLSLLAGIGLCFLRIVDGDLPKLFPGRGFFDAQGDICQLKKARAAGSATGTVFPGALTGGPFQAVARGDPKIF